MITLGVVVLSLPIAAIVAAQFIRDEHRVRALFQSSFLILVLFSLASLAYSPSPPLDLDVTSLEAYHHYQGYLVLFFCLIGYISTSLSSLKDCSRESFTTMAACLTLSLASLFCYEAPFLASALWLLQSLFLLQEFRRSSGGDSPRSSRAFLLYHGVSILALIASSLLGDIGEHRWSLLLALLAISARSGLFPFHGWYFAVFQVLPLGVVCCCTLPQIAIPTLIALLAGPDGEFVREAIALGSVSIALYAAILSFGSFDGRRVMASLVLSQSGIILFAVTGEGHLGIVAGIVTWMVLAVALSGYIMIYGCLEARKGSLTLQAPNGCFHATPIMAVSFLLVGLASIGVPGSVLFLSHDLLLQSAMGRLPVKASFLILSITLNSIMVMRLYFFLFNGKAESHGESDFLRRELVTVTLLLVSLAICSTMPGLLFR